MGQAQVFYDLNKCKEVEKKIYPGFRHKLTGDLLFDNDHVYIATSGKVFEGTELQKASRRAHYANTEPRLGYYPDYEPGAMEVWYGNPPRIKRMLPRVLQVVFHPHTELG